MEKGDKMKLNNFGILLIDVSLILCVILSTGHVAGSFQRGSFFTPLLIVPFLFENGNIIELLVMSIFLLSMILLNISVIRYNQGLENKSILFGTLLMDITLITFILVNKIPGIMSSAEFFLPLFVFVYSISIIILNLSAISYLYQRLINRRGEKEKANNNERSRTIVTASGILGGVLGVVGSILPIVMGLGDIRGGPWPPIIYFGSVAMIFSIIGIIGAVIVNHKNKIAGYTLLISAFGVFGGINLAYMSIGSSFGANLLRFPIEILAFILLLTAGIIASGK